MLLNAAAAVRGDRGKQDALARPVNCHYLLKMTCTFSTYRSWAFSPVGFKHTTGSAGKKKTTTKSKSVLQTLVKHTNARLQPLIPPHKTSKDTDMSRTDTHAHRHTHTHTGG